VDAARQVLRFSIPGAVLLLNGMLCFMIYRRVQGVSFNVTSELMRANVEPLVGVLATIPVGFVVYQAYYFNYGPTVKPWPLRWDGSTVRADRGFQVLCKLPAPLVKAMARDFKIDVDLCPADERAPDPGPFYRHPLKKFFYWLLIFRLSPQWMPTEDDRAVRREAYNSRWHNNWDALRALVDIAATLPGAGQIKDEYVALSDLYHALGAARTAVTASWLAAVVLALTHVGRIAESPLQCVLGLLVITTLSTMLWIVFHIARRRTWKSAASFLRVALRWLLLRNTEVFEVGPG
jgi:hypothetical protein